MIRRYRLRSKDLPIGSAPILVIRLADTEAKELTIHPDAVNPNSIACIEKITVARYLGFRYTASRYTFSPPDLGNIEPNSSHMNSPQKERMKPRIQSMREAPTEPTELRIDEGVEKMPVPMMRPTLNRGMVSGRCSEECDRCGHSSVRKQVLTLRGCS